MVGWGEGWGGGYFLHYRPPTLNPADQLTILPAVAKGDRGRRGEGNSELNKDCAGIFIQSMEARNRIGIGI